MTNRGAATRGEWDARQIARAVSFAVSRFEGSGRYTRIRDLPDLDAARTAARGLGPGPYGQAPMIYAITAEGWSIPVD